MLGGGWQGGVGDEMESGWGGWVGVVLLCLGLNGVRNGARERARIRSNALPGKDLRIAYL
jgi:hypothetical protein